MRITYAVTREESPEVFIAENPDVMTRVLAVRLVARSDPASLGPAAGAIRECLLEGQWVDAIVKWIAATGIAIDVYDEEIVWTDKALDEELAALELRVSRVFDVPEDDG